MVQNTAARYDKQGEQHYDIISAFIKSMRGSDPNGAVYWLARMLEGGEDVRFLARRLVILASEDVGLADPTALTTAVAAAQAVQLIGMPEARLNLAQATIALAVAPKSNAVTTAIGAAVADVKAGLIGQVPPHLRDAHYKGASRLGHGQGYEYPHDHPGGFVPQQYLPDELDGAQLLMPIYGFLPATDPRIVGVDQVVAWVLAWVGLACRHEPLDHLVGGSVAGDVHADLVAEVVTDLDHLVEVGHPLFLGVGLHGELDREGLLVALRHLFRGLEDVALVDLLLDLVLGESAHDKPSG